MRLFLLHKPESLERLGLYTDRSKITRATTLSTNMAEILGAVSAGVALAEVALKIGAGVFELKHMWEGVKGIPETIKLLVEDIEILGTVLKVMETEFNKPSMLGVPWSSGAVSLVVLASRSALDTLTVSINEISKDIESEKRIKRMLSKGKIALQKDVWAKHQKRLERVKWMVQTAQQLWAGYAHLR